MSGALPVSAVITAHRPLTADSSLFTLQTDPNHPAAASFLPGQFLELSLPGVGEIPISYCGYPSPDGSIALCIRHVGHVTTPLKAALPGDIVGVRGPFGNGFPMPEYHRQDLLLVAGGLGMAPIRSLLQACLHRPENLGRMTLLYGAREPSALLFLDELLELREQGLLNLELSVDYSVEGFDLPPACQVARLPALLEQCAVDADRTHAALCGPPVVYPYLVSGLMRLGFSSDRIHLSLERRMKCGIGRCGHCAVGTRLCCLDGPVFSAAELAGIEGALE